MLIIGVVAVFLLAIGWRRAMRDASDRAEAIVDLSARRLASTRPEWGRAMVAELSSLEGRSTRLRFALGCARAAVLPPPGDAAPATAARVVVFAVAAAVIALGILVQRRAEAAFATGPHGISYEVTTTVVVLALVGLQVWLVDRRTRATSASAAVARRWGVAFGVLLGALALLLSLPILGSNVAAILTFPVMLVGCLLTGAVATRASGDCASGHVAGVWAGRVAGSIVAIGLLAATLWATGWFVHDPVTIGAYRGTLATGHFRTIAGYVSSENVDTALISSLLLFPLVGLAFGAVGGLVGADRA